MVFRVIFLIIIFNTIANKHLYSDVLTLPVFKSDGLRFKQKAKITISDRHLTIDNCDSILIDSIQTHCSIINSRIPEIINCAEEIYHKKAGNSFYSNTSLSLEIDNKTNYTTFFNTINSINFLGFKNIYLIGNDSSGNNSSIYIKLNNQNKNSDYIWVHVNNDSSLFIGFKSNIFPISTYASAESYSTITQRIKPLIDSLQKTQTIPPNANTFILSFDNNTNYQSVVSLIAQLKENGFNDIFFSKLHPKDTQINYPSEFLTLKSCIKTTVFNNLSKIRLLYNKGLQDKPNLKGKIIVRFSIDDSGYVFKKEYLKGTINDKGFIETIVREINTWTFGRITKIEEYKYVDYPFDFSY